MAELNLFTPMTASSFKDVDVNDFTGSCCCRLPFNVELVRGKMDSFMVELLLCTAAITTSCKTQRSFAGPGTTTYTRPPILIRIQSQPTNTNTHKSLPPPLPLSLSKCSAFTGKRELRKKERLV
jgi:hypothetical protein